MKRIELFEFEDFDWLPKIIRTGATNLIIVLHKMMGTAEVITELVLTIHKKYKFSQITDLGSGSGGPMPEVLNKIHNINKHSSIRLMLTDLYPNPKIVQKINAQKLENITYNEQSVDATTIGKAPAGLKTMIASFHHMRPAIAKKILQSAQENEEPILIYEIAKNNIPVVVWWLLLPISLTILMIMSLIMTLFVRPLTFTQVLFTYLIPIIPIVYAWDGQASLMRTYTKKDIEGLLDVDENIRYHWDIADAQKTNGKNLGYYIMGYPTDING
ncbi:hypothetical protein [Aquimarina longa]|uniref:hypothetical protein n=1 Tax=Aquimarina longa TaxID=1080221 RepID=UPI000782A2F8|nr:hypothetical protein [Aquimarina longa]